MHVIEQSKSHPHIHTHTHTHTSTHTPTPTHTPTHPHTHPHIPTHTPTHTHTHTHIHTHTHPHSKIDYTCSIPMQSPTFRSFVITVIDYCIVYSNRYRAGVLKLWVMTQKRVIGVFQRVMGFFINNIKF